MNLPKNSPTHWTLLPDDFFPGAEGFIIKLTHPDFRDWFISISLEEEKPFVEILRVPSETSEKEINKKSKKFQKFVNQIFRELVDGYRTFNTKEFKDE